MKLLLSRNQKTGFTGIKFSLDVRADLTPEEAGNIQKYRLADTVLYSREHLADRGSGLLGLASRAMFQATNLSINVSDLARGKRIECKDILEMLGVEEQVREASQTFKAILEACAKFGGEEIVSLE